MPTSRALMLLLLLLALPTLPGCTGDGKTDAKTKKKKRSSSSSSDDGDSDAKTSAADANPLAGDPEEPAGTEGLKALMVKLHTAQKAKDAEVLAEIARNLMPTIDQAKKALADDCDPQVIEKLEASLSKRPADDDPRWSKLFRYQPERTEITVHPAAPDQIRAQKEKAAREFPGGAVQAAKLKVLREDVTFYEVEFTEPGKSMGMKYHLFFHDGNRWRMLGKIWRALPRK